MWKFFIDVAHTRRSSTASSAPTTASHVTVFTSRPAEHNAPAAGKLCSKVPEERRTRTCKKIDKHRREHNNRLYYLNHEVRGFQELVQWCSFIYKIWEQCCQNTDLLKSPNVFPIFLPDCYLLGHMSKLCVLRFMLCVE